MKRIFNIAGPCIPGEHYLLPTLARCPEIGRLVESKQYFVIHAARQSGKTTLLNALADDLEKAGGHYALYCSLETVQGIGDPKEGIPAIVRALLYRMEWHPAFKDKKWPDLQMQDYTTVLGRLLAQASASIDRPLVVLFDEADCLSDQTLITFLRQLRDGFVNRVRTPFPTSVALVGMRNIRDYKAKIRGETETLGSASPFNVITEALTLTNFTRTEIAALYGQHTQDTGQVFEAAAVDRADYWTCGQPWLVNAVARECVEKILKRDYTKPVAAVLIDRAAETILRRRDTHIDSLLARLTEDRVRRVMEPVILGKELSVNPMADDYQFCLDLGLLKDVKGVLLPANPIYAEVILRTLSFGAQYAMQTMVTETPWVKDDRLDMNGLLKAFQQFWRENSEAFTAKVIDYPEAAPHLMLQAYLQRVINGGGQIVREFALGSMRLDLLAIYKTGRYPIEIKLDYQMKSAAPYKQLLDYMDRTATTEGWLVVFDRTPGKAWDEKIRWETVELEGKCGVGNAERRPEPVEGCGVAGKSGDSVARRLGSRTVHTVWC